MISNLTFNWTIKVTLALVILTSCGSGKIVPTKDICSLEKHWKDNIFQVQINEKPINKNYYTHDEAKEVAEILASRNKCMPMK